MYIVVVYDSLEITERKIIGLIYFVKMKDIIKFSNKIISYVDLKDKTNKKYKTYKSLFHIEKVNSINTCKYFCDGFFEKENLNRIRQMFSV